MDSTPNRFFSSNFSERPSTFVISFCGIVYCAYFYKQNFGPIRVVVDYVDTHFGVTMLSCCAE